MGEKKFPEQIVEDVYTDLGHPALSQIGNVIGNLIKFVALPISFLGLTAEELEKKYANFIHTSLMKIPEGERVEPKAVIVAPLLEHVKFVFDEENLSEMFSNLLANAMSSNNSMMVHPAFTEMIKQMSPLDAKFLFFYFRQSDLIELEDIEWKYGEEQTVLTIESLVRLGIINGITYDNREDVAYALTDFGKLFRDVCLMSPSEEEQNEELFQYTGDSENAAILEEFLYSDTFGTARESKKNNRIYIRQKFSIEDVNNGSQAVIILRICNNSNQEETLERVYIESGYGNIYMAANKMPVIIKAKSYVNFVFPVKTKKMLEEIEEGSGKYVIQKASKIYEITVTKATVKEISIYLKYYERSY